MKSKSNSQSAFFIFSFLPALAYWYLEANFPIRIALLGGLALAVVEIVLEKIFTKHIHKLSLFNLCLILFLGGLSLLGDEGIWFKLQPFFTGVVIGSLLLYSSFKGKGLMWETLEGLNRPLPPKEVWGNMEKRFSLFFILYGIFMGAVALTMDTGKWLFFKTAGFYIVSIAYCLVEVVLMRRRMIRWVQNQHKKAVLDRLKV